MKSMWTLSSLNPKCKLNVLTDTQTQQSEHKKATTPETALRQTYPVDKWKKRY